MKPEITIEAEDGDYIGVVDSIEKNVETGPQNRIVQSKTIHVELAGPLLEA